MSSTYYICDECYCVIDINQLHHHTKVEYTDQIVEYRHCLDCYDILRKMADNEEDF
jgi:hypothetical protein